MKKTSKIFLHTILQRGLCLAMLSCVSFSTAFAQAETEGESDSTAIKVYNKRKAEKEKAEKQYPMQTVRGFITDNATRQPLGGVRIQALGYEKYSVLTEEDGTYEIKVPEFVSALYLYVPGYVPQQVAIKKGIDVNTSMLSDNFNAYYTDGTEITAKAMTRLSETSSITVETDIENKLAGSVHSISRGGMPGQGAYLTIRGVNSLNANAQPLIVIDGNIIDPEYERSSLHEGYYNNLLAGLDPENVESIEVLKNGTALYGAKGGNGVIIIKTKRGHSMTTKINVRIYGGSEFTPKRLDVLNGNQYRSYLGDLTSTIKDVNVMSSANGINDVYWAFLNDNPSNYYYKIFHNNTDWQKNMYQNTFVQNYKINVEGGDEIGMYSLSLGYTKADGTQKGNDMSRLNLRFNTDIKIASKLTTGLDIAYNQTIYNVLDNGWSEDYDMQNIGSTNVLGLVQSPMINPYAYYHDDTTGGLELSQEYAGKYAGNSKTTWVQNPFKYPNNLGINESLRNPYWILQNGMGKNKNYAELTQININVSPKYQITKQFSISDRFNYQLNRNNEKYYLPISGTTQYMLTDLGNITSVLKSQFTKETTINNDLRLQWKNSYGAHNIDVFAGWRYNNYSYSYSYMRGYNTENDKLPIIKKNNMQYINYGGTKDNWIDMTYYLNASYNYAHKYFAEFTVSSQASSKFGNNTSDGFQLGGVSWGLFPSLQLGWLISNEKWFKTGKGINYLKLTAGVDQSGNDDLDYYAARTYWESQQVTQTAVGLVLSNIENNGIQWETVTKWNVGLEGSFLNNRLHAGIDLYRHNIDDMLTIKPLDYVSGMKQYWTNEGAMRNTGFEFNANAALLNKKNWKWEVGATIGHYNNKITSLPNDYTCSIFGEENILTAVGHAAGSFYGWQTAGVFADNGEATAANLKYPTGLEKDPYRNFQAGDIHFVDQVTHHDTPNAAGELDYRDGIINDDDKVVIGNPNPDIYGNLYTSLTWKNLRLDVNFKYSLGNDIYNFQRSQLESMNTTYNQTTAVLNRWTYEGQHTNMPKACYIDSDDWRNNERMSDRWIEDGSYLKLKNVRLTYNVPYTNSWLQGLKVWAEGNNLWTVTRYLGTDPEMSSRNSSLYQGIDTGLNPYGRSFNIGLSINL